MNLQAVYQLALMLSDNNLINKAFQILESNKYYRCYCDYALFLFEEMHNDQKALQILKEAISKFDISDIKIECKSKDMNYYITINNKKVE